MMELFSFFYLSAFSNHLFKLFISNCIAYVILLNYIFNIQKKKKLGRPKDLRCFLQRTPKTINTKFLKHIWPDSAGDCQLENQWSNLIKIKGVVTIKSFHIQERL